MSAASVSSSGFVISVTRGSVQDRQHYPVLRPGDRKTGYTTTLKIMQIMAAKGLLKRDESRRSHVYRPAVDAEKTQRSLVDELMGRAFGGSARKLIVHALEAGNVSPEEIRAIKQLLTEYGERNNDSDR